MLAAVLHDVEDMTLEDVPRPEPGPGEAIVAVRACGICQTDYCAFTGKRMNWPQDTVLGHEFSGVIDSLGAGVERFQPGDEVVVSPVGYCGVCRECRLGRQHYCHHGYVIGGDGQPTVYPGAFAELVRVPQVALYAKPPELSFESTALTEPLAGSFKGMIEYSQLRLGEDVVIVGAGGMGLLLAQCASAGGAGRLILIDLVQERLKHAHDCGATHTLVAESDVKQAVYDLLPDGPDIVFEAAGSLAAASLCYELCRRGTRLNMFGVITPGDIPVSPGHIHFTEIRMDASFSVTPRVMTKSLDLQQKGLVDPGKIITHRFPLSEIHRAFATMEERDRVKIVVHP